MRGSAPHRPSPARRSGRSLPAALAAPLAVVVLLAGLGMHKHLRDAPDASADAYHAAVREAVAEVPERLGPWEGREVPVPPGAVRILRPNALVNREYVHVDSDERANLLIVHCRDTRDLIGHYPPVCYPANGFARVSAEDRDYDVDGRTLRGRRYVFSKDELSAAARIVVDHFMLLPDGTVARDMDAVNDVAQDLRLRRFGAAQVQVLTSALLPEERREAVFRTLVNGCLPVLDRVGAEVKP